MSRIRSRTAQPSSSGIETSRTTRSGRRRGTPGGPRGRSARPGRRSRRARGAFERGSGCRRRRRRPARETRSYGFHTPGMRRSITVGPHFSMATILIVDPDAANRSLLELLCLRLGHRPIGSREWVGGEEPDLMLLEPVSRPGVRLARGVRRRFPELADPLREHRRPESGDSRASTHRPRHEALPPLRARACARTRPRPETGSGPGSARSEPSVLAADLPPFLPARADASEPLTERTQSHPRSRCRSG